MLKIKPQHIRRAAHVLAALPLLWLGLHWAQAFSVQDPAALGLGEEPVKYSINFLGLWAIRVLLVCLSLTPVRKLTHYNAIMAPRRALGLWAFAYVCVHLIVYFSFDLGLVEPCAPDSGCTVLFHPQEAFAELLRDVVKHPFILFGMMGFVLLLPLAITSTKGWIKKLKAKNWQKLHKLVYGIGVLACIHFIMRVKGFQYEPWLYAAWLAFALGMRVQWRKLLRQ
jgi:methionine sulfoxide reductase heme-binding subunit